MMKIIDRWLTATIWVSIGSFSTLVVYALGMVSGWMLAERNKKEDN